MDKPIITPPAIPLKGPSHSSSLSSSEATTSPPDKEERPYSRKSTPQGHSHNTGNIIRLVILLLYQLRIHMGTINYINDTFRRLFLRPCNGINNKDQQYYTNFFHNYPFAIPPSLLCGLLNLTKNKEPRSYERGSKLLHLDSNQGQRD